MAAESPTSVRKVVVHLRATGDAPILKQSKFKIAGTDKFAKVIEFLRRQLHRETLFVYVNSAFSPNPDELVVDLYNITGIFSSHKIVSSFNIEKQINTCSYAISFLLCSTPIFQNFGFDGKLVVNYACSMAWG
ncbi:unnamed protein product [Vicia faba]|uniref:Ubiquitin-like protein ATG12 n=1 Tax=Vicia faba TaxID=3906 RepID=A0AAV1AE26_VICFA|nr:unnamed protein product [Vicia faba]